MHLMSVHETHWKKMGGKDNLKILLLLLPGDMCKEGNREEAASRRASAFFLPASATWDTVLGITYSFPNIGRQERKTEKDRQTETEGQSKHILQAHTHTYRVWARQLMFSHNGPSNACARATHGHRQHVGSCRTCWYFLCSNWLLFSVSPMLPQGFLSARKDCIAQTVVKT